METPNNTPETLKKSYRLPADVLALLDQWAEETKQSQAQVLINCVRAAAEDLDRIIERATPAPTATGEIVTIPLPHTRDQLADVFTSLMARTQEYIGERDRISALGVARARVYKLTDAYQERKAQGHASVYEDEHALAENLSETGGVSHWRTGMREKGRSG